MHATTYFAITFPFQIASKCCKAIKKDIHNAITITKTLKL